MTMKKLFLLLFFAALSVSTYFFFPQNSDEITTIFGKEKIDNPLVKDLLESPIMERIKSIDQSGVPYYYGFVPKFSRYEHSVGVYALLKRYNAPLNEQVAGLMHDTSHTVFSHLRDLLFNRGNKDDAYQDSIHNWYLKRMNMTELLARYDLEIANINPKKLEFSALEQDLPGMCADRIEYNLHTALIFEMMDEEKIESILEDLHFDDGKWYFTNADSAEKFANLSLHFTEHF